MSPASHNKDYYKILGVTETTSPDQIKQAYRKLAVKFHPDKNPKNPKEAEAKFKEISEAYYVLSDDKRKAQYDQMRRYGATGAGASGARGGAYTGNFAGAQGFNFDEFLRQFSGGGGARSHRGHERYANFEDIFADIFTTQSRSRSHGSPAGEEYYSGFGTQPTEEPEAAADVRVNLKISKVKADKGGEVQFKTPEGKTINLKVPPKTRDGQKLRLTRQGRLCPTCHHEGDLILQIKVSD